MNITDIIKLISMILAISIAGERLITLLKTVIPGLADSPPTVPSADPKSDWVRKAIVMILAFLSCWVTAAFVGGPFNLFKSVPITTNSSCIPVPLLGLLASGGSAFWTSLLGYTKAIGDIKVQQFHQELLRKNLLEASFESHKMENRVNLALNRIRTLNPPKFDNKNTLKITRI